MTLEPSVALRVTQLLLGIGIALQAAEVLATRSVHARLCVGKHPPDFWAQWLTAKMLVRLVLSAVLIVGFGKYLQVIEPVFYMGLIFSTVGLVIRFNGPLGGGSDSMTFQVLIGLLVASFGVTNPILVRVGMGWIAAHSVLSYFLAGVAKLKTENWRTGLALQTLLRSNAPYTLFAPARNLADSQTLCAGLSWMIILFEIAFPLVLILPWEGKLVLLSIALLFHITNAVVLGLNRFIWAWAATYPALLYFK
jgi:hypothetical protein